VSTSRVMSPGRTGGDGQDHICRYTLSERVHHWVGFFAYFYCLVTGLAFWSPYMYWLASLVGGGPTARFWHPWFGIAFTLSMFWMYKMWRRDMFTTDADRRWSKVIKQYIENDDQDLPPEGRFNYGQKLFFWLMFYGVILLVISGLGMRFVESIPLPAIHGCYGTRGCRDGDYRRFYYSRLHGHGHGPRRLHLDHSGRS
jgi:formate dehydrogenase gamma subunit